MRDLLELYSRERWHSQKTEDRGWNLFLSKKPNKVDGKMENTACFGVPVQKDIQNVKRET